MPSIGVAVQSMLLTLLGPQCDCQTNGKYGSKGMHIPYHGIIISSSLPSSLSSSPALRGSAAYGAAMVQETVRAFLFTDVRCHRLPVATLYTPPQGSVLSTRTLHMLLGCHRREWTYSAFMNCNGKVIRLKPQTLVQHQTCGPPQQRTLGVASQP
jgi:hypothetical protein